MSVWIATAALVLAGVACGAVVEAAAPVRVSVGEAQSHIRKLAARELEAYLGRMFVNPVDMSGEGGKFDFVVGTPESSALVAQAIGEGRIRLPEGKNADQGYSIRTLGRSIYVTGRTDIGVLYGVYALLESYGAYFQIDGEVLPEKAAFKAKKLDICLSPVFKYRGLLPWDNFSCGMSGYDLADYQKLIDCATRMRLNMLQFHFYNGMAFFTETVGGKTADPSCIGMPVDVFKTKGAIGQKAFGGAEVFGPRPYVDNTGKPRAQAEAVQEMMRKALDYARERGWVTCVGFELMSSPVGNPTYTDKPADNGFGMNLMNPLDPHNIDVSVERYRSLVKTYPRSDFYWMWQSEARGILSSNIGREPGAAEFRKQYEKWAPKRRITGDMVLGGDIDYAYLFREVANRLTPEERSRLATGGWSVEHLFPQIDAEFPKELTFASLNSFDPGTAIDRQIDSYRVAKDGRRAWMIDWWEFDGEQWFPQFRANWQETMYRRCAENGVESVTLLGWKLSAIEHNVRYLAEFAWNPKLTSEEFYRDYALKVYGGGADVIAAIYEKYDKVANTQPSYGPTGYAPGGMYLSPGWESMPVPSLPRSKKALDDPAWKNNVIASSPDYIARLEAMWAEDAKSIQAIRELIPLTPALSREGRGSGAAYARMMVNRLEVRQLYARSLIELYSALMAYDQSARTKGTEAAAKSIKRQVGKAVACARMAVEKYAEDIRNKGDQGVVAQLNEQYYQVLKRLSNELDRMAFYAVDWTAFRIRPSLSFDFSQSPPWGRRDGKCEVATDKVDGRPIVRLKIGGDGTQFNSAMIHGGEIDLEKAPFLDFHVRTSTNEPLAIMFQLESGSQAYYALNLVGDHELYVRADSLPEESINDGKWHRVTWDLRTLVKDGLHREETRISNIIIGSWKTPSSPIEVEFRDFSFGERNMLD